MRYLTLIFIVLIMIGIGFTKKETGSVKKPVIGKVSWLNGEVKVKKADGSWVPLKSLALVKDGDVIKTGKESAVEITSTIQISGVTVTGSIARIAENSEVKISGADQIASAKIIQGKLWANILKRSANSKAFSVTTFTATAAVRGTVFSVEAEKDSSSTVKLYNGKVDVGPADTTAIKKDHDHNDNEWGPPKEIPGPYEVSLETWITLEPGESIHIKSNGTYQKSRTADASDSAADEWERFNQKRDSLSGIEH